MCSRGAEAFSICVSLQRSMRRGRLQAAKERRAEKRQAYGVHKSRELLTLLCEANTEANSQMENKSKKDPPYDES